MSGSDNDRGLVIWVWGPVLVAVLAGALLVGGCGVPNVSSWGLTWDNSVAIERERTKASINTENNITARRESDNWHATAQEYGGAAMVVGVVLAIGWAFTRVAPHIAAMVIAWAARPHRPQPLPLAPPATVVMLAAPTLAAAPEARLEWSEEDGVWIVVNDRTKTITLLEDKGARNDHRR